MEVHHHSHTERKKFTHYLWEFIMLFLAVFCGFLADNQREHLVEHTREKQFINSICADLESDTINLNDIIIFRKRTVSYIDSLRYYLKTPDPDVYGRFIYFYARRITGNPVFLNNDRTIQQLKNGGNLRLIRKKEVSDSIMRYDWEVRRNEIRIEREETYIKDYVEVVKQLFDNDEFDKIAIRVPDPPYLTWKIPEDNPRLLHTDKESIEKLISSLHFLKSINLFNLSWNESMKHRASELSALLKRKYHLQ